MVNQVIRKAKPLSYKDLLITRSTYHLIPFLAYNLLVPTPFYHLDIAQRVLNHPGLPEPIQSLLDEQLGAFFLGSTAPDVRAISGQSRSSTHFYTIPLSSNATIAERVFKKFPHLAEVENLLPAHTAFVAGYISHIQADLIWLKDLFFPYFFTNTKWGNLQHRMLMHNVLRTYMDENILASLPEDTAERLQGVEPHEWLPFITDENLRTWRDFIAEQLAPGGNSRTVEVFAERLGVSMEEFSDLINSVERLDEVLFSHLPRQVLVEYQNKLVTENIRLLETYLDALYEN